MGVMFSLFFFLRWAVGTGIGLRQELVKACFLCFCLGCFVIVGNGWTSCRCVDCTA